MSRGGDEGGPDEKKGVSNTAMRFLSVLPLIPLILWLMFTEAAWGEWGFRVFVLTAVAIGSFELMRMTMPEHRAAQAWGVAASILFALAITVQASLAIFLSAFVLLVIGALVSGLARPDPVEGAAARTGWLIGGPLYVGLLALLDRLHGLEDGGAWVLLSMFIAWFSDTGAYFAGRAFGRHKLYPKLSPKKTVEGALGGLAGSVVGALLVAGLLIESLPILDAIVLALFAGALGQAGDLFESLLKRSTGVKDSGAILPGHGGILDRADALIFTGAVVWLYATWLLPSS